MKELLNVILTLFKGLEGIQEIKKDIYQSNQYLFILKNNIEIWLDGYTNPITNKEEYISYLVKQDGKVLNARYKIVKTLKSLLNSNNIECYKEKNDNIYYIDITVSTTVPENKINDLSVEETKINNEVENMSIITKLINDYNNGVKSWVDYATSINFEGAFEDLINHINNEYEVLLVNQVTKKISNCGDVDCGKYTHGAFKEVKCNGYFQLVDGDNNVVAELTEEEYNEGKFFILDNLITSNDNTEIENNIKVLEKRLNFIDEMISIYIYEGKMRSYYRDLENELKFQYTSLCELLEKNNTEVEDGTIDILEVEQDPQIEKENNNEVEDMEIITNFDKIKDIETLEIIKEIQEKGNNIYKLNNEYILFGKPGKCYILRYFEECISHSRYINPCRRTEHKGRLSIDLNKLLKVIQDREFKESDTKEEFQVLENELIEELDTNLYSYCYDIEDVNKDIRSFNLMIDKLIDTEYTDILKDYINKNKQKLIDKIEYIKHDNKIYNLQPIQSIFIKDNNIKKGYFDCKAGSYSALLDAKENYKLYLNTYVVNELMIFSNNDYDLLVNNLMNNIKCIENKGGSDILKNGNYLNHICILAANQDNTKFILLDPQGYNYSRYVGIIEPETAKEIIDSMYSISL